MLSLLPAMSDLYCASVPTANLCVPAKNTSEAFDANKASMSQAWHKDSPSYYLPHDRYKQCLCPILVPLSVPSTLHTIDSRRQSHEHGQQHSYQHGALFTSNGVPEQPAPHTNDGKLRAGTTTAAKHAPAAEALPDATEARPNLSSPERTTTSKLSTHDLAVLAADRIATRFTGSLLPPALTHE